MQALEAFPSGAGDQPAKFLASCLSLQDVCIHLPERKKIEKLERKALAVLRLAEQRADLGDDELVSRLGESYFQYGDWSRARKAFLKAIDSAEVEFSLDPRFG